MSWIWEQSSRLTAEKLLHDVGAVLAPVSKDDIVFQGRGITNTQADYCVKKCELSDSVSFCPRFVIPNDPSAGVLSIIVDIAEGPTNTMRTIPISEVISRFNVSAGLDKCARGDVIVDKGTVLNAGSACDATVQAGTAGIGIQANLVSAAQLRANVAVSPGLAVFSPDAENFHLRLNDGMANAKWGGPIVVAARARKMEIASAIDGSQGRTCVALIPDVAERTKLFQKVESLRKQPAVIAEAAKFLVGATPKNGLRRAARPRGIGPDFPDLFPLTSTYRIGIAQNPKFAGEVVKFKPRLDRDGYSISLQDVLLVADVARCGEALRNKPYAELAALLPKASAAVPLTDELRQAREQRSGELILCRFGSELIDATLSREIADAFPVSK